MKFHLCSIVLFVTLMPTKGWSNPAHTMGAPTSSESHMTAAIQTLAKLKNAKILLSEWPVKIAELGQLSHNQAEELAQEFGYHFGLIYKFRKELALAQETPILGGQPKDAKLDDLADIMDLHVIRAIHALLTLASVPSKLDDDLSANRATDRSIKMLKSWLVDSINIIPAKAANNPWIIALSASAIETDLIAQVKKRIQQTNDTSVESILNKLATELSIFEVILRAKLGANR